MRTASTISPRASFLSIGNELLDGRTVNTNLSYVGSNLRRLGFHVDTSLTVDDNQARIVGALSFLAEKSDLIVISGGLGPTSDDLTRESVAEFLSLPLEQDEQALQNLKDRVRIRKLRFDPSNLKQALFPKGKTLLSNPVGTAAGFAIQASKGPLVVCFPGVPSELIHMFEEHFEKLVSTHFQGCTTYHEKYFHLFGLPESHANSRLESITFPKGVELAFRVSFPELEIRLSSRESSSLEQLTSSIPEALGEDLIFSRRRVCTLPSLVHEILIESDLKLSLAESCTGGLLSTLLVQQPSASTYYEGAIVSYSNTAKSSVLGVKPEVISGSGAVSHQTARHMAEQAREQFDTQLSISVTGIAGPGGGSVQKPVGTFFVGLSYEHTTHTFRFYYPHNSREMIQRYAAFTALDCLRRYLSGLAFRKTRDADQHRTFQH